MVAEFEVPSMEAFLAMGSNETDAKAFEEIMKGYHELVDLGRREIHNLEG